GGERLVALEELGVLAGEDVVGDDAEAHPIAERAAQRQDERGLAAADGAADADGEGAAAEVAAARRRAVVEVAGVVIVAVVVAFVHGQPQGLDRGAYSPSVSAPARPG